MLHLRLRVPGELVDDVVGVLDADPTVTDVAVVRDAYLKPAGTLVLADVARENASGVVAALRRAGLADRGAITLDSPDTVLSPEAARAERVAPGAPDDGVVWVSVEQRLRGDSRFSWTFAAFMTLAVLIAGAGRITDQTVLIVGAMVVGPDFAPVAAVCFALARRRPDMVGPALRTLAVGLAVALVAAVAVFAVAHLAGGFTRTEAGTGELTEFIIRPDGWSLVVACLAGTAGALSLTSSKSGPLVGVFISVTTIPAVGTLAVALAVGLWGEAWSALAQLGLNLLGLLVAGTATLLVQGAVWRRVALGARGSAAARPDRSAV